jgi:lipoprotein-releasing system permease protein
VLSLRLALTFLFSKKRYGIINAITWLAALVSVFVAAAMIIILSAFNGLQSLIVDLYSSIEAPYSIVASDQGTLTVSEDALQTLQDLPYVEAHSLRCSGEVIYQYNKNSWYGTLIGSDDALCDISKISRHLDYPNDCSLRDNALIIGAGIRYKLRYPFENAVEPLVVKSLRKDRKISTRTVRNIETTPFKVSNAFSVNAEYDLKYAFTTITKAQQLLGYKSDEFGSIEILASKEILDHKDDLSALLNRDVTIVTEDDRLGDMKRTANIEKWVSLLMLSLVMLIAAFNLIAAITMLIIAKRKDLQTLSIMGMSEKDQRRIFSYILGFINLGGALVGLTIGALIIILQEKFGLIKISDSVVDYYPVQLHFTDAVIVFSILIITAVLAQFPVQWVSKRLS